MTSCQSRCWSVRAAAVNPGQHYLRKEISLWKHQPSPLAASSTNTPRAPRGRWGGCGSRVGLQGPGEQGTVAGVGGQFGSGADKQTPSAKAVSTTRNMVHRHTIGGDYKLYKRIRLHQCGDLQLQVLQVWNRHIMSFLLRWRCLSVLQHVMNLTLPQALTGTQNWWSNINFILLIWSRLHTM